ncbi:nudix hydrolase 20, chloroplastic-like [Wolffia australiana]
MESCRVHGGLAPLPVGGGVFLRPPIAAFRRNLRHGACAMAVGGRIAWDDVLELSSDGGRVSDLAGYFERVRCCNRGSENKDEFLPFLVEEQTVGYIHPSFVDQLKSFSDVFILKPGNDKGSRNATFITLHPLLRSSEERTMAVGDVIKAMGSRIPGIRNELYPVSSSFGQPAFFSLERAAAPYFGIKAYGVHMNGYVEKEDKRYLWIAKRSNNKPTYPGMLDHLVAGGLPHGISCKENIIKECQEEAGIPESISRRAVPVGAVSYVDIDGPRYKRDVLFCYDIRLPQEFVPKNEDGEVESFKLVPVEKVASIIRQGEFFKPNCALVIIDFLFRHGYVCPDDAGYLELLQLLRSGASS